MTVYYEYYEFVLSKASLVTDMQKLLVTCTCNQWSLQLQDNAEHLETNEESRERVIFESNRVDGAKAGERRFWAKFRD